MVAGRLCIFRRKITKNMSSMKHICGPKALFPEEIEENGGFVVEALAERIFEDRPRLREQFQEKNGTV